MSAPHLIITEQCGSTGDAVLYLDGVDEIIETKSERQPVHNFQGISNFLKKIALPNGYPESVSHDYLQYQIWETCQAFCNTIVGAFRTRAVLKSVGVGDGNANALSAAVTLIVKDGTGMFGNILFACWKGTVLDCDCKQWRYFADILNDFAMFIELCLPLYTSVSMQVLCITSVLFSIAGVAGGATRASITHHQAIRDNMAEIAAKNGGQVTAMNLMGSFGSILLLNYFNSSSAEWILILSLMILHLSTNYLAIKALVFNTLNKERLALVLQTYIAIGAVLNPANVNKKEPVLIGNGLKVKNICGFDIVIGQSMKNVLSCYSKGDLKQLRAVYENKKYMLFVNGNNKKIYVCLEKGEKAEDLMVAYFHAVCLGIATSIYNSSELDIYSKRKQMPFAPIVRLYTYMESYEKYKNNFHNIPPEHLSKFNDFLKPELDRFLTSLNTNGWNISAHCLKVDEFRSDWKRTQLKKCS